MGHRRSICAPTILGPILRESTVRLDRIVLALLRLLRTPSPPLPINNSAIILVVDSTDRERLPIVKSELHKMATDENLVGAAMLVLANKQDVRG